MEHNKNYNDSECYENNDSEDKFSKDNLNLFEEKVNTCKNSDISRENTDKYYVIKTIIKKIIDYIKEKILYKDDENDSLSDSFDSIEGKENRELVEDSYDGCKEEVVILEKVSLNENENKNNKERKLLE